MNGQDKIDHYVKAGKIVKISSEYFRTTNQSAYCICDLIQSC